VMVCSGTSSSAPSCQVTFRNIPPSVRITIEVANTDFSGSNEYITSITAGSVSMGTRFLASGGADGQCDRMSRILDSEPVPSSAVTGGELTVRIETSSSVGCCTCNSATLYAVVTVAL